MFDVLIGTIASEFSDIPNLEQFVRLTLRLSMASILGGIIGYERESKGKAAGMRTHMLVALGSALFVLIPLQAGVSIADLTRVLQGLVAGIGFLGAGAIIQTDKSLNVRGLTTAASIWLTAAIGTAAGMGRESSAVLCTVFAVIVLAVIPRPNAGAD